MKKWRTAWTGCLHALAVIGVVMAFPIVAATTCMVRGEPGGDTTEPHTVHYLLTFVIALAIGVPLVFLLVRTAANLARQQEEQDPPTGDGPSG